MSMEGFVRADTVCGHHGFCLADIGGDVVRVITTAIIGQNLSHLPGTASTRPNTKVTVIRFDRRRYPYIRKFRPADARS